ncbi:MAG: hypothetical protein ABR583_15080 [Gaiellaceae bacterium]
MHQLAALALSALLVALAGASSPREARSDRVLSDYGIRMRLPAGWDSRFYWHQGAVPSLPVLQAANFPLPHADDDLGSSAVSRMTRDSLRVVLLEVGNPPGRAFPPTRLPITLTGRDVVGSFDGIPPTHTFARRPFSTGARSFLLYVDFGVRPPPRGLLSTVNRSLATLTIRPFVSPREWKRLHRRAAFPSLRGGDCPRTRSGRTTPQSAFGFGRGPVYVVLGTRGVVSLRDDIRRNGSRPHKTLWAIAPRYQGPLLVRGVRLGELRPISFALGGPFRSELRLDRRPSATRGWRYVVSTIALPGRGCYALRVDGTSFSETVVVAASG